MSSLEKYLHDKDNIKLPKAHGLASLYTGSSKKQKSTANFPASLCEYEVVNSKFPHPSEWKISRNKQKVPEKHGHVPTSEAST